MIGFAIYVKLLTSFAFLWNSALSYRKLRFSLYAFSKLVRKWPRIEPALANKGKWLMIMRQPRCLIFPGRPLGDYINQYETLNYDTASLRQQHNRVRRSSPNSDQRIELKLKTEKR